MRRPTRLATLERSIKECTTFIEKESKRPVDTRPLNMQQHLDFCIKHKAILEERLISEKAKYNLSTNGEV